MCEEILVAYLTDGLSPEQREEVEARLAQDENLRQKLRRIQECLAAAEQEETPERLADRTCRAVRIVRRCRERSARLSESNDAPGPRWQVTMLDWLFVGGIAATVVMLVVPAVEHNREMARRLQCQDNLRAVTAQLLQYSDLRGRLPQIGPHQNAGHFVVELTRNNPQLRKMLADRLVCPASELAEKISRGRLVMRIPTDEEIKTAPTETLETMLRIMSGSYAYHIGYIDPNGEYLPFSTARRCDTPLLADAPSTCEQGFRSQNHGGCFNTAFLDGSVRYGTSCAASGQDEHIFLNDEGEHRAGLHKLDVVLARSEARPLGLKVLIPSPIQILKQKGP